MTAAGTVQVKDISPGTKGSGPFYMTPAGGTPDDFARLISAELKQWTEVARQANVVSDRN